MKKATLHFRKLGIRSVSIENYNRGIYFLNFLIEDITYTEMAIALCEDGEEIPEQKFSVNPSTPVVAWFEFEQLTLSGIFLNMVSVLDANSVTEKHSRSWKEARFLEEVDDMIWKLPKVSQQNWERLRIVQNS